MQALARETGSLAAARRLPRARRRRRRTSATRRCCCAPTATIAAIYRKIHLFDVDVPGGMRFRESESIEAGDDARRRRDAVGPLGLTICYDLRFPELYRALVGAGRAPAGRAVGVHARDRQGSLARAAARARHREPGLRLRARAVRAPRRQPAQLGPRHGRRSRGAPCSPSAATTTASRSRASTSPTRTRCGRACPASRIARCGVIVQRAPRRFDLVVIGSGPAGEKGAAQAAYFGKKVALVEKAPALGGASVHTGTLPSKTLRETALYVTGFQRRSLYGMTLEVDRDASLRQLMGRLRVVTEQQVAQIERNMRPPRRDDRVAGARPSSEPERDRRRAPRGRRRRDAPAARALLPGRARQLAAPPAGRALRRSRRRGLGHDPRSRSDSAVSRRRRRRRHRLRVRLPLRGARHGDHRHRGARQPAAAGSTARCRRA